MKEKVELFITLLLIIMPCVVYQYVTNPQKENLCKYENSIVIKKRYNNAGVFFNVMKNYKMINGVYLSVEDFSKYKIGDTIKCEKNNINIKK